MTAMEKYQDWLKTFADDPELVQELSAIAGDAAQIEDRFYKGLEFGTAGMRGVLGYGTNRMNVYNVRRATQGLADFILEAGGQEEGVAIAYDSRRCSPEFALEAAKVLCANGHPGISVRIPATRARAFLHRARPKVHRRHRDHRQPQSQAVQRLQGLLAGRRPAAPGAGGPGV